MKAISNEIEKRLTLTQKLTILLYSANDCDPVKGKLWYQKELYLISRVIPDLAEEAEFESDFMGPYSELADEQTDRLKREMVIDPEQKQLTKRGQKIAEKIEAQFSPDIIKFIAEIKGFLNDLSKDELLGFIYYVYPDMRVDSLEFKRISTKREEIAVSLFRKNKISLGRASLISGLPQEDVIDLLQSKGISVFAE